jgi:DNA-directed RNA polymerase II subunit RPB1
MATRGTVQRFPALDPSAIPRHYEVVNMGGAPRRIISQQDDEPRPKALSGPSQYPFTEIASIQLYVLGSEDHALQKVVTVTEPTTIKDHAPARNGLTDLRMGPVDKGSACGTCGLDYDNCPGHFGEYILRYPVLNMLFKTCLIRWLKTICFQCGKPVVRISRPKVAPRHILQCYANASQIATKDRRCTHCNALHPRISKGVGSDTRIMVEKPDTDGLGGRRYETLYPHEMRAILERVTKETVIRLGFDPSFHPRKLILDRIRVPPNPVRPENRVLGSGHSKNNDLTAMLQVIIRTNESIPEKYDWPGPDAPDRAKRLKEIDPPIENLQTAVHALIKGSSTSGSKLSLATNSGKPFMSIARRLPTKYGRIRRNLMGRRVRVTSRSFITCDNTLKLDQVGFPLSECKIIQKPEVVREYNYEEMKLYFMNGIEQYPGASRIKQKSTGKFKKIGINPNLTLEYGDILYRDIVDDDMIGFNRQPSLLPSNMTGQRAKIMTERTFRLNLQIVEFYNADFDGDAMMCVFPRSGRTQNELEMLAGADQFFVSYQTGLPTVGNAHDSLIGMATLTQHQTRLNKYHAMFLFVNTDMHHDFSQSVDGTPLPRGHLFTGQDIVSHALVASGCPLNYTGKPEFYKDAYTSLIHYHPQDIKVVIEQGVHRQGILDTACLGKNAVGGIYHITCNQYGAYPALRLSYNMQQIALTYIQLRGFTVGLRDILPSTEVMGKIHEVEDALVAASIKTTEDLNRGRIVAPIGQTVHEFYERKIAEDLSPDDKYWKLLFPDMNVMNNGLLLDVLHGVRGKMNNVRQVNAALGRLEVNGNRFAEAFDRRCLPHCHRFDPMPQSRGYIPDGYNAGLDPVAFLFHAMEARYQIVSRALNTSKTGYQNRMSVKNMESDIVDNFRRVSNSHKVLQLMYGADGADPRHVENVSIPTFRIEDTTTESLERRYRLDPDTFTGIVGERRRRLAVLAGEEWAQILADRESWIEKGLRTERISGNIYTEKVQLPVHVGRLFEDVAHNLHLTASEGGGLDPIRAIERVRAWCEDLGYCLRNNIQRQARRPIPGYIKVSVEILAAAVRAYLNVRNLQARGYTDESLDLILHRITHAYQNSLVSYSKAVGVIASQCLSEPGTQLVLDSHHTSGAESTKKQGLKRLQDLLAARHTTDNSMTLFPILKYRYDEKKVKEIASMIEELQLEQFYTEWKVVFDRSMMNPLAFPEDLGMIKEFIKYHPNIREPEDLGHLCVRILLDKTGLVEKNMGMEQIYQRLRASFPDTHIVYSNDNDPQPMLRVYVRTSIKDFEAHTVKGMVSLAEALMRTTVRGVPGVRGAYVRKSGNFHERTGHGATAAVVKRDVYYIETSGSNLARILELPYFDHDLTQSDGIQETLRYNGITAAHNKIINELRNVIPTKVVYRHYMIYADEMTSTGVVTSIDRYGSAKRDAPILLRMSDSTPLAVIEEAALANMKDHIHGVSAAVLVGRTPRIGSTASVFLLDEKRVRAGAGSSNVATQLGITVGS